MTLLELSSIYHLAFPRGLIQIKHICELLCYIRFNNLFVLFLPRTAGITLCKNCSWSTTCRFTLIAVARLQTPWQEAAISPKVVFFLSSSWIFGTPYNASLLLTEALQLQIMVFSLLSLANYTGNVTEESASRNSMQVSSGRHFHEHFCPVLSRTLSCFQLTFCASSIWKDAGCRNHSVYVILL